MQDAEPIVSPPTLGVVSYAFDRFITPILWYRRLGGEDLPGEAIVSFFIFLGGEAAYTCVQLNDETQGWTPTRAMRNLRPSETLRAGDLVSDRVSLPARPTASYIAGQRTDGEWHVDFNFSLSSPRREEHLVAGEEFHRAARDAAEAKLQRPFVENAFLATEHFLRAELLSYGPTLDLVEQAKTHRVVASTYNLWSRLGNTEQRFADLLNDLGHARGTQVYANKDPAADQVIDSASALQVLKDLQIHVQRILAGDGPHPIKVIATRDIRAGSLIGRGDYTLKPPQSRRSSRRTRH
jgi:hypothetical protein